MRFQLVDAIPLLSRTPAILDAWLRALPEGWDRVNEGGESWSAFDIVGHLIVGEETDWMPRARIILEHGEARTFDRFDRFAQIEANRDRSLPELLDRFALLRRESVAALQELGLAEADLKRRGTHPGLGPVALGDMLAAWVAHDFNHLHQLARVMAVQYRQAVGPWADYLGVMRCGAHGDPPGPDLAPPVPGAQR